MDLPEAGWKKPPGSAAEARVLLDRGQDRFARIRRVDAQAPGLQAVLSGRFTADGNAIERIDIHRLKLGDSDLAGTVARRAGGGWRADIHAPVLDARELLKKDKGGSAPEKSDAAGDPSDPAPLAVNARIGRLLLGPKRELRQVAADLLRDRRGMAVGPDRRAISGWRRPMAAPRRGERRGTGDVSIGRSRRRAQAARCHRHRHRRTDQNRRTAVARGRQAGAAGPSRGRGLQGQEFLDRAARAVAALADRDRERDIRLRAAVQHIARRYRLPRRRPVDREGTGIRRVRSGLPLPAGSIPGATGYS